MITWPVNKDLLVILHAAVEANEVDNVGDEDVVRNRRCRCSRRGQLGCGWGYLTDWMHIDKLTACETTISCSLM